MANLFILGAGGFGTALAVMARNYCGASVTLWTPFEEEAKTLAQSREHTKLLPGIPIPEDIAVTTSLEMLSVADLALVATPSSAVRETARRIAPFLPDSIPVACVAKGLEADSYKTLAQILEEELPRNPAAALSGPSHAEEVARGVPTTVVAAARQRQAAEFVQDFLMNETFRIYVNDDLLGVELGGALKNIIALAAGIVDGLGIGGDNTKAALMTRGITEIARLGIALGAKSETFGGLSGMGDLIVTCSSMHSRNRRCGILIGQGKSPAEAVKEIGMTVEGYPCTKTAWELAERHRIDMPIVEQAYRVLYRDTAPLEGIRALMARPKRHESETIWLLTR
ncbi:MAG: NAD(P)H-dependent glycerol-3-phosphate dehydrogenase [Oscillospiraceae bacterium]